MATVYNQAIAHRFGVTLIEFVESGEWDIFEIAVAWVRRSGTRHLLPSLREFLEGGGIARFTVGVDIENTSREGLEDLLSLRDSGDCKTFVYHNEASVTFHPKIYLFRNDKRARLIIGSNNITESGLFTNTEVGLQVDARLNDSVIVDIRSAMDSWCDTSEELARELDEQLLDELSARGYITPESAIGKRIASSKTKAAGQGKRSHNKLFGTKAVTAPKPPVVEIRPPGGEESGGPVAPGGVEVGEKLEVRGYAHPLTVTNVLLMRIRVARDTQTQIPLQLYRSAFFEGCDSAVSGHDGRRRPLGPTHPERGGGSKNTCKVEMRESVGMEQPVLRLDRSEDGIEFHCYDAANSVQGAEILRVLEAGRHDEPPSTVVTRKGDPESSTWYRFV